MNFISPEIKNFTDYLIKQFPKIETEVNSKLSQLSKLDFNKHIRLQETYAHTINLVSGDTISLIWNIDSLIQYIQSNEIIIDYFPMNSLLSSPALDLTTPTFQDVLKVVSDNRDNPFIYKTDYVIFSNVPFFDGAIILDGNHRFANAIISNKSDIKCCFIPEEISYQFLQPTSKEFIDILYSFSSVH